MADSKISWTDKVWNVTRGCRRVSPGCGGANGDGGCYAERMAYRFSGPGQAYEGLVKLTAKGPRWTGAGRFVTEKLAEPLTWRQPARVFVDSMSDLFYDAFTNEQIAAVFGVMAACPQHTFQVLTKRARRMREWFEWVQQESESPLSTCGREWISAMDFPVTSRSRAGQAVIGPGATWPLPNVWIGVSVENQAAADERIPELLATPAEVRFLSCEPLIGPVTIRAWLPLDGARTSPVLAAEPVATYGVDWVIAGCESGPGARRCDVAWLRALRDQCTAAGVPFFLKQAEHSPITYGTGGIRLRNFEDITAGPDSSKTRGVIELPYLDGVQHAAFPAVAS